MPRISNLFLSNLSFEQNELVRSLSKRDIEKGEADHYSQKTDSADK